MTHDAPALPDAVGVHATLDELGYAYDLADRVVGAV
jgi:hypothetical protein